jgi:hypothetical protein
MSVITNIILTIIADYDNPRPTMAGPADKSATRPGMPPAVVWRRIEELHSDLQDFRSNWPNQIRQLTKRIAAFGFNLPILIDPGLRIIAGYVKLLAARELGWREVPTIRLDHLSPAQAQAFMIADDRLAETASWDDLLLAMQLKEVSPAAPNFRKPDRRPSPRRLTSGSPASVSPRPVASSTASDGKAEHRADLRLVEVSSVRDGDLWLLGNHRVHCGNAGNVVAEMLTEEDGVVVVFAPDPAAVDTIIRRWQTLTGGTARRAADGRGPLSVDRRGADEPARN